jgi:hypothetical protein
MAGPFFPRIAREAGAHSRESLEMQPRHNGVTWRFASTASPDMASGNQEHRGGGPGKTQSLYKTGEGDVTAEEKSLLVALAWMCQQYLADPEGKLFGSCAWAPVKMLWSICSNTVWSIPSGAALGGPRLVTTY